MCLRTRTCAITGKPNADIHHVDKVGMGANRRNVDHTRYRLIALSRDWHTKVHAEGEAEIFKKYKVHGIYLDKLSLQKLGIQKGDID